MVSKNDLSPVSLKILGKMAKAASRWPGLVAGPYTIRKSDWKGLAGANTLVGKGLATRNEDGGFELTELGRELGGVGQQI